MSTWSLEMFYDLAEQVFILKISIWKPESENRSKSQIIAILIRAFTVLTFVNLRDLHEFTQQIYRPHLRFTRGDLHLSLRFTRYRFTSFQKLRDKHWFETFEETRFTSIPKQEISMFSENESVLRRLALFDICKTSTCW